VGCFVWSTLPSSLEISNGKIECEIYEGKHRVDSYIRDIGLPAVYVFTGNFYENQIFRSHVVETEDGIEFRQPIIRGDVKRKSEPFKKKIWHSAIAALSA
jgi:hypothetical protein